LIEDFQLHATSRWPARGQEPLGGHQHAAAVPAAAERSSTCSPTAGSVAGHAKALLGTPDRAFQERWPTCRGRGLVGARGGGGGARPERGLGRSLWTEATPATDAAPSIHKLLDPTGWSCATRLLELEELLADCLSTKVAGHDGAKRGKLVIDFADLEDLERLYHLMSGVPAHNGHTGDDVDRS
jgi:hypothetical protein